MPEEGLYNSVGASPMGAIDPTGLVIHRGGYCWSDYDPAGRVRCPKGKKQATPLTLKAKTVSKSTLADGSKDWTIRWELSKPSPNGGIIIQEVTMTYTGFSHHYWEAWNVPQGSQYTDLIASVPNIDDEWTDSIADGFISSTGSASYYDGIPMPPTFKAGNVPNAGDLPSTDKDPAPYLPSQPSTPPVIRKTP